MARHLTLLRMLAALAGALSLLVGVSMAFLAIGAVVELASPEGAGVAMAAGVTAVTFGLFAVCALAWGAAHLRAASLLRQRRPSGRLLMMGLGICDLVLLPFGTALGVYALWVLASPASQSLFERHVWTGSK
jgi:hypothetical protein